MNFLKNKLSNKNNLEQESTPENNTTIIKACEQESGQAPSFAKASEGMQDASSLRLKATADTRQELGKTGEGIVARKLEKDGFKILDKNYKRFYGEIDLIAAKKDLIVFVEVKMLVVQYVLLHG